MWLWKEPVPDAHRSAFVLSPVVEKIGVEVRRRAVRYVLHLPVPGSILFLGVCRRLFKRGVHCIHTMFYVAGLFTGHDRTREWGQEVFGDLAGRVGSGPVGSGQKGFQTHWSARVTLARPDLTHGVWPD